MDARLIFASGRRLRLLQVAGIACALAAVLVVVALDGSWLHAGGVVTLAVIVLAGLEVRIRRSEPELRLSPEGIEGPFGLIEWSDVTAVEVRRRPGLRGSRVVLRLRPGTMRLLPTGEFADIEAHELSADRLALATGHLELRADELAREIERFRNALPSDQGA